MELVRRLKKVQILNFMVMKMDAYVLIRDPNQMLIVAANIAVLTQELKNAVVNAQ